ALAEQAQQAEAGHFLSNQRGCCAADVLTDRIDGAGKRIGAIAIEFEQAFDASRGLRLAVAQFRQPRAARDRLELERLGEQVVESGRASIHAAPRRSASQARAKRRSRSTVARDSLRTLPISTWFMPPK